MEMNVDNMELRTINVWDEDYKIFVANQSAHNLLLDEDGNPRNSYCESLDNEIGCYVDDDKFSTMSDIELEIYCNGHFYDADCTNIRAIEKNLDTFISIQDECRSYIENNDNVDENESYLTELNDCNDWDSLAESGIFHDAIGKVIANYPTHVIVTEQY